MSKRTSRSGALIGLGFTAVAVTALWPAINSSASANGPGKPGSSASATASATATGSTTSPTTTVTTSAPAPAVAKSCDITGIVFYHKDATGDDFGPKPTVTDSASAGKHFEDKFCPSKGASDPSFAAVIITAHARAVATHTSGVDSTTVTQAQAMATAWVTGKDTTDWTSKVTVFVKTIASYEVKQDNNPVYSTFNMQGGKDGQPTLTFTDNVNHPAGLVVVIHFNDGTPDMTLRLDCDLQPTTDVAVTPSPTTGPTTPQPTGSQAPPCTTCGGTTPCTTCKTSTTPPPCGSACNHTTPPTTRPTTPSSPPHSTTPPPPAPKPAPLIVDYTRLNDVDAGQSSPNYRVIVQLASGDSGTLCISSAYGSISTPCFSVGGGVTTKYVTYTAPYDAGTGSDTITINLTDNTLGKTVSASDTFKVNPPPVRP
ncbi:MAG TPA: hypothetical protein VLG92_02900 [Candidatus Saccharimonadia bacterium]|nr:hypothetical protein [Candidatus Saccharimonadia bacterium]